MVKVNPSFWKNKKILLTGHTGFKGSWLLIWLLEMGADVYGFSDKYEKDSLFDTLLKQGSIALDNQNWRHFEHDLLDKEVLNKIVNLCNPDIVIHMAAQAIVRESYKNPLNTWNINVNGTLNLLNALESNNKKCSTIIVTTDKVYENVEDYKVFKENDKLGGHDPYSASKASVEIAVASWRNSFLKNKNLNCNIATARAGNVIGGGDNSKDRIVPDVVNALLRGRKIKVRNPYSLRPWQHVLESLNGYLILCEKLYFDNDHILDSFNFGPDTTNSKTVKDLVNEIIKYLDGEWENYNNEDGFFEAKSIKLDISKSKELLGWKPSWDFENTVEKTIMWYKDVCLHQKSAFQACLDDINSFIQKN